MKALESQGITSVRIRTASVMLIRLRAVVVNPIFSILLFHSSPTVIAATTEEIADYVMLSKTGAKWIYNYESEITGTRKSRGLRLEKRKQLKGTLTITNEGERSFEGVNAILFAWKFDVSQRGISRWASKVRLYPQAFYFAVSPAGITLVGRTIHARSGSVKTRYDPPKLYVKNPIKIGDTWNYTGSAFNSGSKTSSASFAETRSILGRENVTVPAGTFEAVKLAWVQSRGITTIEWWVKGIGLVKSAGANSKFVAELESYSIPGKRPKVAWQNDHAASQQKKRLENRQEVTKRNDLLKESRPNSRSVVFHEECRYGYSVRGDVAPEIDMSSDATATEILDQAVSFIKKVCRVHGYDIIIELYQSDKLVVGATSSGYHSHKPGMYQGYRNTVSAEKLLGGSDLIHLGKHHYLFFIGMDENTGTKFWRYSRDPSKKCWEYSGGVSSIIGEVPTSVALLNHEIARSLLLQGQKISTQACPDRGTSARIKLVPIGYRVVFEGNYVRLNPILVAGEVWRGYPDRGKSELRQYKNRVVEREEKRLEEIATAKRDVARKTRWNEFSREYGVSELTSKKEVVANMHVNPFAYQGKTVAIYAHLKRMVSPDTGLFGDTDFNILVSSIPRNLFTARSFVVLVGQVLGSKEGLPHLKFVGAHFCKERGCSEILPQ